MIPETVIKVKLHKYKATWGLLVTVVKKVLGVPCVRYLEKESWNCSQVEIWILNNFRSDHGIALKPSLKEKIKRSAIRWASLSWFGGYHFCFVSCWLFFFVFAEVVDTRLRQSRHSCKPQQQQLKYLTIHAMSLLPGLEFNISTPWSSVAHESLPCHDNHQSLHSVGWGFSVTLRVDRLLQPFKGQVVTCEGKVCLPYVCMYVLLVSSYNLLNSRPWI